jgi:hypothetical protein
MFDLSNLSEAILFANHITTMPASKFLGREEGVNNVAKHLEMKGIFSIIDETSFIDKLVIEDIIYELKGAHEIGDIRVKENLAKIISYIFRINTSAASRIISNISRWGDSRYHSSTGQYHLSDFDLNYNITLGDDNISDIKRDSTQSHYLFKRSPDSNSVIDMISVTYLRALLYFRMAGYLKINYQPDSIRAPIIAYLNKIALKKIDKYSSQLIRTADSNLRKKIKSIDTSEFTIKFPLALSMTIKSCIESNYSRDKFLDKALELRDSKEIKKLREWLAELETALNSNTKKYGIMKDKANYTLKEKKYDFKEALKKANLSIHLNGMSIANIPIGEFVSATAEKLQSHLDPKYKSLIFLRDLDVDLIAKDEEIQEFLGKLSAKEINNFRRLNDFRRGYLQEILIS